MFRVSSLEERKEFYAKEFNSKKCISWFKIKPQLLAVDLGTETGIIKDKKKINRIINFKADFKNLREKLVNYMPEDIYYDRNLYRDVNLVLRKLNFRKVIDTKNWLGQELAFDVDADNIECKCKKGGLRFCVNCLEKAKKECIRLYDRLNKEFNFLRITYSGRGYHLHVDDKEAFKMSVKERRKLNNKLKKFPIDPWVSAGRIRLIRLPYSLNSLVSRIVIPLNIKELNKFDPLKDRRAIPKFLTKF